MRVTSELKTAPIRVASYSCDAGPDARPFTEMHEGYSVSHVRRGRLRLPHARQGRRGDRRIFQDRIAALLDDARLAHPSGWAPSL